MKACVLISSGRKVHNRKPRFTSIPAHHFNLPLVRKCAAGSSDAIKSRAG